MSNGALDSWDKVDRGKEAFVAIVDKLVDEVK